MLVFADKRIPKPALKKLSDYSKVIPFSTQGISYPAISCHPDIFFVQSENTLIVAPNIHAKMKDILSKNKVSFKIGETVVGTKYPQTAAYNAVVTEEFLIHNLKYTDKYLFEKCSGLEKIHIKQAYTRCNLLALKENQFITSDRGIEKTLEKKGLSTLFINPEKIILPGMKNGFFGGCCGISGNTVFIIGNLDFIEEGNIVRKFITDLGYEIVELYDGPLFDGGSLVFI